jgi:hypothetical protein
VKSQPTPLATSTMNSLAAKKSGIKRLTRIGDFGYNTSIVNKKE